MDYVYMPVISLTIVGFGQVIEVTGNVPAQIFAMLIILAVRHDNGKIEFNPQPSQVLTQVMTLIIMGDVDNIARAKKVF